MALPCWENDLQTKTKQEMSVYSLQNQTYQSKCINNFSKGLQTSRQAAILLLRLMGHVVVLTEYTLHYSLFIIIDQSADYFIDFSPLIDCLVFKQPADNFSALAHHY